MPLAASGTGIIYVKNPTAGEAIDPTTVTGATLTDNPYLDDQLCCWRSTLDWPRWLPGTAGPCGSNSQSTQLLSSSTAFSTITLATSPGINGPDALLAFLSGSGSRTSRILLVRSTRQWMDPL